MQVPAALGDSRRHILFFSHTRQVSGAERVLLHMLAVLDNARFRASVCCPVAGPGNLDEAVARSGFAVEPLAALNARFTSNPVALLGYLRSLCRSVLSARRAVRKLAPDLIHANSVRAGLLATLATFGSRTSVLWHIQDELPRHPISSLVRALAWSSRRTRFAAVSRKAAQAFTGTMLRFGKRMTVLHNGVDLRRFPRKTEADRDSAFRRSLGMGPGELLLVSIGIINPRKGLLELIEAFAVARERMPQGTRLALVGAAIFPGDAEYLARIHGRIAELALGPHVQITGPADDVAGILRTSDLMILNARVEPFGLVLVEAAASGTAILASETGGASEVLGFDPPCGFLTPLPQRSSAHLLADRLAAIANDAPAREAMAERAYLLVCPRFSLEAFAANLNTLYAGIFATDRRGSDDL